MRCDSGGDFFAIDGKHIRGGRPLEHVFGCCFGGDGDSDVCAARGGFIHLGNWCLYSPIAGPPFKTQNGLRRRPRRSRCGQTVAGPGFADRRPAAAGLS